MRDIYPMPLFGINLDLPLDGAFPGSALNESTDIGIKILGEGIGEGVPTFTDMP